MSASRPSGRPGQSPAMTAAEELRRVLGELYAIKTDVHDGYGLAVVSVWVGLLVWTDGSMFWWRTGWDAGRKRALYAFHPVTEPERAAHRAAFQYSILRGFPPPARGAGDAR